MYVVSSAGSAQVSPVLTGARQSATRVPFTVSPQVSASVDVGTGNLMVTTTDHLIGALNGQLQSLGLTYNSLTLGSGSAVSSGEGGRGWFMPFGADTRLVKNDDGLVLFLGMDSEQGLFKPASGGGYVAPATMNKTLTRNSDGTWTVLDVPSLTKLHFTTGGRLDTITDRNGNVTTFTYTSGEVSSIQSAANFYVQVSHYDDGRIAGITDWDGPDSKQSGGVPPGVEYLYDGSGRLASIRQVPAHFAPSPVIPSTLEASFAWTSGGDLASITDGDGDTTAFTYDSSHRVTSVSQGVGSDQAVTRFGYVSSTETDVAGPDTNQLSAVGSVPHTTYALNPTTELVSKATDPLGHSQSATYTPFNDVASATNGVGGTMTNSYSSGVNSGHSVTQSTSPTGAFAKWSYGSGNRGLAPGSWTRGLITLRPAA
ncbi:RHS repeat protein [Flexivirga caeni]|uniref:RHS repeat protein n=1 Tax=Flexivirga caeni TaxID=2294115 RepID=A0A3M9MIL7_9MICO|nr:RHS repeat protein [Flexivirga caeni]RNI25420.1 RHS repeat protein [Flexivirga caeni]